MSELLQIMYLSFFKKVNIAEESRIQRTERTKLSYKHSSFTEQKRPFSHPKLWINKVVLSMELRETFLKKQQASVDEVDPWPRLLQRKDMRRDSKDAGLTRSRRVSSDPVVIVPVFLLNAVSSHLSILPHPAHLRRHKAGRIKDALNNHPIRSLRKTRQSLKNRISFVSIQLPAVTAGR